MTHIMEQDRPPQRQGQIWPPAYFVSKVLLAHSQEHSFTCGPGWLSHTTEELAAAMKANMAVPTFAEAAASSLAPATGQMGSWPPSQRNCIITTVMTSAWTEGLFICLICWMHIYKPETIYRVTQWHWS